MIYEAVRERFGVVPRMSYVTRIIGEQVITGLTEKATVVGVEMWRGDGYFRAQLVLPTHTIGSEMTSCECFSDPETAQRLGGRAVRAVLLLGQGDTIEVHGNLETYFERPEMYTSILVGSPREGVDEWNRSHEGMTTPIHFCPPRDEF